MTPRTLRFLATHPLTRDQPRRALLRYVRWQVGSRLVPGPVVIPFVGGSKLLVEPGMTGATGNVYVGLQEFEAMGFTLHALRAHDAGLIDVGANVGVYTVLAGAAVGTPCIALEPVRAAFNALQSNVRLNGIGELVTCLNVGAGREEGTLRFSVTRDTMNHVVAESLTSDSEGTNGTEVVKVVTLDEVSRLVTASTQHAGREAAALLIKVDVEGWTEPVLAGATEVLRRSQPTALIVEIDGGGERYGFDDEATHSDLLDLGYQSVDYSPFERHLCKREGRRRHGNTLYVNDYPFFAERVNRSRPYDVLDRSL